MSTSAATNNPLASKEPWDLVAEGYAAEAGITMAPFSEAAVALVAPAASWSALDVAAGSGVTTFALAPRVARVHAIDFSAPMIAALERSAAQRGLTNIEARVGDGQALPFDDRAFDAAFSMFGLMFFPDRARGLTELLRVLRSGGPAVVSSWAPAEESSLMTCLFGALRAADPSRPSPQRDMLSLDNPERLRFELESAGFVSVEVHPHVQAIEVSDAETLWDKMARSNAPLRMMAERLGESAWAAHAARARDYLMRELGAGPVRLSTKALIGLGRKP